MFGLDFKNSKRGVHHILFARLVWLSNLNFQQQNNSTSTVGVQKVIMHCTMSKFVLGGRFKESELFSE